MGVTYCPISHWSQGTGSQGSPIRDYQGPSGLVMPYSVALAPFALALMADMILALPVFSGSFAEVRAAPALAGSDRPGRPGPKLF